MTVRKTLLALGAGALLSAPGWALPGAALSHPNGPPSSTPNNSTNPGASHRSSAANDAIENKGGNEDENNGSNGKAPDHGDDAGKPSHHGKSHKCKPHSVGYVASGTLESWSLTKNADGTYSGSVTVKVAHTNHHASGDKSPTPKEYKVEGVHLTFGLSDTNNDGSTGLDDLAKGDAVMLLGKITSLAKKCSHNEFTAKTTIRHIVFHGPSS